MRSFEELLIEQCAPTLAGIKTGSLFRYQGENAEDVREQITKWSGRLQEKGLSIEILKNCQKHHAYMVYVYRKSQIEAMLSEPAYRVFLKDFGYRDFSIDKVLMHLSSRYCLEEDMPHEIGVFLGFPLSDVKRFIEERGQNYTVCGYWKCYGNAEEAKEVFTRLRSCKEMYKACYACGMSVDELTVAA